MHVDLGGLLLRSASVLGFACSASAAATLLCDGFADVAIAICLVLFMAMALQLGNASAERTARSGSASLSSKETEAAATFARSGASDLVATFAEAGSGDGGVSVRPVSFASHT